MGERALITGIGGQDAYYLSKLLHARGYQVVGTTRPLSEDRGGAYSAGIDHIDIEHWDLVDQTRFADIIGQYQPSLIFNLAAFSSGEDMNSRPVELATVNGLIVLSMLETLRELCPTTRFVQASSSEVFGAAVESPQTEVSAKNPRSVYGVSKLFADGVIKLYRERYGIFCASAILYNHESPHRAAHFVTRKITQTVAAIFMGRQQKLILGNLSARRDWGHSRDYVEGMLQIGLAQVPDDYVLATGVVHTIREFVDRAFECVGINLDWSGQGVSEVGTCRRTGKVRVAVSPDYFRPDEIAILVGDASKARENIGWLPKEDMVSLIKEMVDCDIRILKRR